MAVPKDPVIELAKLIKKALPLAREIAEEQDPARRVRLRDLVAEENFELNNMLTSFCSERMWAESSFGKSQGAKRWPDPPFAGKYISVRSPRRVEP